MFSEVEPHLKLLKFKVSKVLMRGFINILNYLFVLRQLNSSTLTEVTVFIQ